ncbi:MAG: LysR family transcriptional regulator [Sulfitobacter sp.]
MARSLPPLTWFRAFEAAARHLSFTAAADEIGLTQSAISQHVKALETRLRVALFVRQARGLTLTDEGRKLLPKVGAALEALAAATASFDTGPAEDLITIAASVSVAQWVIAPVLNSFTTRHPEVRLRFLSAIWPDDFHSAQADVEIRFGSERQVGKTAEMLRPNRLIALKSPQLEGALDQLPLIEAVGTSDGWRSFGDHIGTPLQPEVYVDSYGMALHLAAHDNGVALVSELLSGHALSRGTVVRAHEASIPCKEGYFLSLGRETQNTLGFRDWLLEQIAG